MQKAFSKPQKKLMTRLVLKCHMSNLGHEFIVSLCNVSIGDALNSVLYILFLSVWEDQKCTTRLLHSFSNCTFLWHSFLPIFYDDAVSTKRNAVYYMRLFSKWGAPLLLLLPHWSISWVLLYEIEQKNPRLTYLEKANETCFRPLFKGLNEF